jgi:methylmalonyl-CoA/ethylmalonyl-CoA epimerase
LAGAGVELVDQEPRPGMFGHTVAFVHPRSVGGVLAELVAHEHE